MKNKKEIKHHSSESKHFQREVSITDSVRMRVFIALGVIILISIIVYLPIFPNAFLQWDDSSYIENNPLVHSFNLGEIFSQNVMGNYHPFTILILAVEYHLFGLNPAGYHAINLILHLLNTLLVFYAVYLLSDKALVGLVASLLFGIHPLHVESVAWISELKDLLYTLFFLASYVYYLKYIKEQKRAAGAGAVASTNERTRITDPRQRGQKRVAAAGAAAGAGARSAALTATATATATKFYYLALALFAFSLLSKAMAVSLPLVLILTDYFKGRKIDKKTLIEKVPFFVLALIFGLLAIHAQKSFDYIQNTTFTTFPQRAVFASYGFITYLIKMLFPLNLSAFYPYPVNINGIFIPSRYHLYFIAFLALAIYLFFYGQRLPKKVIFGLGFFTITILLVLQLLPVGKAIMADRYSYIPSIGIFYLAGEGFMYLLNKKIKWPAVALLSLAGVLFSVKTYARCGIWKDDMTLWNDIISQNKEVEEAYYKGYFFDKRGNTEGVKTANSDKMKPGSAEDHFKKGTKYANLFQYKDAIKEFTSAVELKPDYLEAYNLRGIAYVNEKKFDEAIEDFTQVIELKPGIALAYNNRGIAFYNEKRNDEALSDFTRAIELDPGYVLAYNNKGNVLYDEKKFDEAVAAYSKAIELKPDYKLAWFKRGMAEYNLGQKDAGCMDMKQAADLGYNPAIEALAKFCK